MKRKALVLWLLLLLLASTLLLAEYNSVSASDSVESQPSNPDLALPVIYIRSDGSVERTNLIERNGDTYTFKGDIGAVDWDDYYAFKENSVYSQGIVVERDNIIIDGAGYALTGCGHTGIYYFVPNEKGGYQLTDPPIYNTATMRGIDLWGRSNITIKNLTIQLFRSAISISYTNNITVLSSTIQRNEQGLNVYHSTNLTSIQNNIRNAESGIYLQNASQCLIFNNTITDTRYGIQFWSSPTDSYYNKDNVIANNQFTRNIYAAILLCGSLNNFVVNNNITNNNVGISVSVDATNLISNNLISNNNKAIDVSGYNAIFVRNQIINNNASISFYITGNNTFYSNNFIGNAKELVTDGYRGSNFLDNGKIGNYWSSYNGSDRNWDGIGDTPYNLSATYSKFEIEQGCMQYIDIEIAFGVDNYPLMSPLELSGGYDDLPLWAIEKLVSLNLLPETEENTDSVSLSTVMVAAVSAALAIAITAGLIVYFKKRKR
jgi:parallel beta-helix repeat protein